MQRQSGTNNPKVLVVEDDALLRKILCQTIQRIGFTPLPSSDGEGGLELLKSESIDIVVSDILMPKMTGLELLQKAANLGFLQPFIIISSQNKRDVVMQALKLGAFDFIDKPFQASVISQVMDEAYRYSQRLHQFASSLLVKVGTEQDASPTAPSPGKTGDFQPDQMEQYYLLRLLEASANPFGNTTVADSKIVHRSKEESDRFFFETAKKALESTGKRLEGMSKFQNSSWDIGVILRTIHSIKMAAGPRLHEQTINLIETLENCFALLRLYRECMNKEIYASLQLAQDSLVRTFDAEATGADLPDIQSAFVALEKFEAKLNKSLAVTVL